MSITSYHKVRKVLYTYILFYKGNESFTVTKFMFFQFFFAERRFENLSDRINRIILIKKKQE